DVVGRGRTQVDAGLDRFLHGSEATGGNAVDDPLLAFARRPQHRVRLFGVDEARAQAVDLHVTTAPFDGERLRHRDQARLRGGRVNGAGAADPGVARGDAEDLPAALREHATPGRHRAVRRPVQYDVDDRVPAVRRDLLRATDEVPGRVVDKHVEAAGFPGHAIDGGLDRLRIAD